MNQMIEKENIENLIYEIKGKQVMIDSDLAKLYECKNGTKEINQAVKNNLDKFPKRFSWILTDEEEFDLRSKVLTSSLNNYGGRRYNTRVFTEQGVAMLATILKSRVATQISIKIMDAFVAMRHYIGNSEYRLSNLETKIIEHDKAIMLLQESFKKFEKNKKTNEIYFNGQIFDAYYKISEIFKGATKKLVIIDAYADNTILDIVKNLDVNVIVITRRNSLLTKQDILRYNKQYNNLKVCYDNTFHDRYFILDDEVLYHCGTSVNRIGYKTFSITLVGDKEVQKLLIEKVDKIIKNK